MIVTRPTGIQTIIREKTGKQTIVRATNRRVKVDKADKEVGNGRKDKGR